ncbi:MAG: hypothetical protein ACP5IT_11285 [Thermoproteota archaeon]
MTSEVYEKKKKTNNGVNNLQAKLEKELERLKSKTNFGFELHVVWLPNYDANLSGEVKGNTIYIYDDIEDNAIETLKHEFVDYLISEAIRPYKLFANKLVQLLNEEAYKRKEKVVEALERLLSDESEKQVEQCDFHD